MKATTLSELLLSGAAKAAPDHAAVLAEGSSLTWGEFLTGARGFAAKLQEAGIGRGHRVGLWLEKTPAAIQALAGTLLAGAAYVPLDPRAPWRRCRTIAEDGALSAIVIDRARVPQLRELVEGLPIKLVLFDDTTPVPLEIVALPEQVPLESLAQAFAHAPAPLPDVRPDDVAYVLYTSGSTGVPKGVVHTHASGLAFTHWVMSEFGVTSDDVFSSHAPLHFDLSISDIFASLGAGARVRLFTSTEAMLPTHLARTLSTGGITVWYSVPSVLVAMLDRGGLEQLGAPDLKVLFFAGEVFPTPQLRRLRRAIPHVRLCNLFGPTETNVCTWYEVPAEMADEDNAPIPIGKACAGLETFALDDEGKVVAPGTEGTLWARGGHLMHSYWNDAERTQRTLKPDPRGLPGVAYCTGDRVRERPDGHYDFLGRRDHMVKTRGCRVDLGEVEAALASHPDVLEVVVIALPDPSIGNRLVAIVAPRSGAKPEQAALRAFCRERLPAYMVPEQVAVRAELPRTSTGKADRTALRAAFEHAREEEAS